MTRAAVMGVGALAAVCVALAATGCGAEESTGGPIVYQSPEGLAIVSGDGSGSHAALPPTFGFDARHADWSPDGSQIVFVADEPDGTRDIWTARADGSNAEKLVDCRTPCVAADSPAWSPDGSTIAYVTTDVVDGVGQGVLLRFVDPETEQVRTVASTAKTPAIGIDEPRWSPDGKRLVVTLPRFSSAREDGRFLGSALGIVQPGELVQPPNRITGWDTVASYPDWHPSENLIVFQGGSWDPFLLKGKPSNLFAVEPDGDGLRQLTSRGSEKPWIATPAWAPDGKRILVTLIHGLGEHTLATIDRDGGDPTEIVDPANGKPVPGAHLRQAAATP